MLTFLPVYKLKHYSNVYWSNNKKTDTKLNFLHSTHEYVNVTLLLGTSDIPRICIKKNKRLRGRFQVELQLVLSW
jgi:hypothetical protein